MWLYFLTCLYVNAQGITASSYYDRKQFNDVVQDFTIEHLRFQQTMILATRCHFHIRSCPFQAFTFETLPNIETLEQRRAHLTVKEYQRILSDPTNPCIQP
jgi:hypothetical protein